VGCVLKKGIVKITVKLFFVYFWGTVDLNIKLRFNAEIILFEFLKLDLKPGKTLNRGPL
jgi:hypothetical protein